MRKDPRIDARIAAAEPFAKPILTRIRRLAHQASPEVEETLKWGMPHFTYKGGILFGMASFKAHAVLGFWLGSLVIGDSEKAEKAMGQFGRMTSIKDLPPDKVFIGFVRKAMKLLDQGVRNPTRVAGAKPKPPPKVPAWLQAALRRDAAAQAGYKGLSAAKQREYVEWLVEARTEETRERRLAQALEWMAEGKGRNWKYEKKK